MIIRDKPRVLIGFAEAFSAIEAVWSLQDAGVDVFAFTRRGSVSALRRMPGVTIIEVQAPEQDLARCRRELSAALIGCSPDGFLPLDDSSLWLSRHIDLTQTVTIGPDLAGVDFALNKAAQIGGAMRVGMSVPTTVVFDDVSEVRLDNAPVIVKPADAVLVSGNRLIRPNGRICADDAELRTAIATMLPGPVLRQRLVRGVGEGVFGYVGAGGPADLSAHRRLRMLNPQGSASSACESIDVDPQLADQVIAMLDLVKWRGLFMAEFLRDSSGTPWFMELNGRAWGSLALARRRGFEYPAWAVQSALGLPKSPPAPTAPPHLSARHLGREIAHLAFVFRGPQTGADVDWPKRAQTIRALMTVHRGDRLYNWNRRHPEVLARDTWHTLSGLASSRRAHA
ncbi:MAG: hypothetical protein H7279_03840 [Microbacteriaceae bacterium]|nr:hypothetical protein [Microbacteriaceae bacterium]